MGYREANAALKLLNETLEGRVAERTRALEDAERRYRTLVEQLPAITYLADLEPPWTPRYVSPQLHSLLGYAPETWVGSAKAWLACVHEDDADRVRAERRYCAGTKLPFRSEYRLLARDGRVVWVRDEAVVSSEGPLQRPQLQGILLDVTYAKQLEEQFRQAQRAESIGRLAGGIAHDFNNLLSIVLSYAEIMMRRLNEGDPLRRDAEEIRKAGERAADLTSKLLAYSREQTLQTRVVDLNRLVREMGGMLRRVIGEDITLETELAENLRAVQADPGQVEQVLMNLVVNARDAMPQGGTLHIATANQRIDEEYAHACGVAPGEYASIVVTDTGVGMAEDVKSRIFEPFFTTKERGRGTGLGLATSYGIIKQSGGWIAAESALGAGAAFGVHLPAVGGVEGSAPPRREGGRSTAGTETVLLVEDEPAVRKVTARILAEQGYQVLQAGDGVEALVVADAHPQPIHLLLTDVIMPGMGGRDLAEHMRAKRPDIRVLFTSGYTDEGMESDPALLPKPYAATSLLERVRESLDV
jgi:PAS domain S-box-containing protein